MSLLKGSVSFVEYSVSAKSEGHPLDETVLLDAIRAFAFCDIDDKYEEYSVGWVSINDMFDSSFNSSPVFGDYVVMSMRVDMRKIPGAVLKKYVEKECRLIMRDKQIPRLGRAMKVEIKGRIKEMLLKDIKPTPSVVDIAWNMETGRVFFMSLNGQLQHLFVHLFEETFRINVSLEETYGDDDTHPDEWAENHRDFIMWLWWASETGLTSARIGNQVVLVAGENGGKVSCSNELFPAEAYAGMAAGKLPIQAKLSLENSSGGYVFTFALNLLEYKGVKLPKTAQVEGTKTDDDEFAGMVLERIYLLESLVESMRELFNRFDDVRLGDEWGKTKAEIGEWVAERAAA